MKITFVGTGMIGGGLAANAALNGNEVILYDVLDCRQVEQNMKNIFDILVEAGAVSAEKAGEAFERLHITGDLAEAVRDAEFIQECVPERLELKQSTYRQIQEITGDGPIIASSTSGMFPSDLSRGALFPEKIIVGHPYNPSYLLPLIEVCGPHADDETLSKAMETYKAMGKVPILCRKEVEGFIVNQLSWAVMGGAMKAVDNGVCTVEDVDKGLMYGPGLRMAITGQLLTMSLGVPGGFRQMSAKYKGPDADPEKVRLEYLVADGVDEEIANRPEFMGNTVEDIIKFRDKTIADILKLYKKL